MTEFSTAFTRGLILAVAFGSLAAAPAFAGDGLAAPTTKAETTKTPAALPPGAAQEHANPTHAASGQTMAKLDRTKMPEPATMSRSRVKAIQSALAKEGEHVTVDGIWGPKTAMAVKDFQKSHDLKTTGHLDPETVRALPKVG